MVLWADPQNGDRDFFLTHKKSVSSRCLCVRLLYPPPNANKGMPAFASVFTLGGKTKKKRVAALCTGKCDFSASKPLPCYPGCTLQSKRKNEDPLSRGGKHAIIIRKSCSPLVFLFVLVTSSSHELPPPQSSSGSGWGSPWVTFVVGSKSTLVSWP